MYVTSRTNKQNFVSVYRVYFAGNGNIFMWIYELQFPVKCRLFATEYLCVSFVGDGVKHRPGHFIREHMGLEIIRENERDVNIMKAYIKNY
jgi:hypothetical protein